MDGPALVSLTFDDGSRCHFEIALPMLDQYGFPATFFLHVNAGPIYADADRQPPGDIIGWSRRDIELLRYMVHRGHEIGSHSVTHCREKIERDPKGEAEGSKRWFEDRLGGEISSYAYPQGHITEPIKDAVKNAGYKQARWSKNGAFYCLQGQIDYFQLRCRQITSSENVDDWIVPGCWHVLMFHGIGDDGWSPIPQAEFTRQMAALARHRDSGNVDVVTFKDGADRLRQAK